MTAGEPHFGKGLNMPQSETRVELSQPTLTRLLNTLVEELRREPEYAWNRALPAMATDADGRSDAKLAAANCAPDFDPWDRLRNPALAGLHPLGFEDLWNFYAAHSTKNIDEDGRATIFRVPQSYESALENIQRVVLIPVMIPVAPELAGAYAASAARGDLAPDHHYLRGMRELVQLVDAAVTRMAYRLMGPDRTVLAMTAPAVKSISQEILPSLRRGNYHGACKGDNYTQKSVAVLAGLGQFGAHRLVMRDEIVGGRVRRFMGPVRSLVVFDPEEPREEEGLRLLTEGWRDHLFALHSDDPGTGRDRFCRHYTGDPDRSCSACFEACPADAIASSATEAGGDYPTAVAGQEHRFWDGALQFDYRRCLERRTQLADIYDEWICGRCLATCVARGGRSADAVTKSLSHSQ